MILVQKSSLSRKIQELKIDLLRISRFHNARIDLVESRVQIRLGRVEDTARSAWDVREQRREGTGK